MTSSPKPLAIALDTAKRLHNELASRLTAEQRRDFLRIERLIQEAEKQQKAQMTRNRQTVTKPAEPAPARRKAIWRR